MRFRTWLFSLLFGALMFATGWAAHRPQALPPGTEYFNLAVGLNVAYDDGTPLLRNKDLRLKFFRVGDRRLPPWQFVTVMGRPDEAGFMSAVVPVPMESWRVPAAKQLLK